MKACWFTDDLLPNDCIHDNADSECCLSHLSDKNHCQHWDEELALDLAREIIGGDYVISRK